MREKSKRVNQEQKRSFFTGGRGEEDGLPDSQFFLPIPKSEVKDDSREEASLHNAQ